MTDTTISTRKVYSRFAILLTAVIFWPVAVWMLAYNGRQQT